MPKSIVCEESNLIGDITISAGCVIHPSASIVAEHGPIVLGENCIIEEYAKIIYKHSKTLEPNAILHIGSNNVFEVGCMVQAQKIGDKNVFECKCEVGPEVTITSGCIIGAGVKLYCPQELNENSVIFGKDNLQREAIEKHGSQTLQIDFLRKVLPNYHHLRKPNYDPKKARAAV